MHLMKPLRERLKLSRIPAGHWRCKFRRKPGLKYLMPLEACLPEGSVILDAFTWISPPRHVSREIADQVGWKHETENCHYVEAVFFKGEKP